MANNNLLPNDEVKSAWEKLSNTVKESFKFSIDSFVDEAIDVDAKARKIAKSFGQGSEFLQAIKVSITDSVGDVVRLGGEWSNIVQAQKDYSSALGRNVILQSDLYGKLYATTEVLGTSTQELTKNFKDAGFNIRTGLEGMEKVLDVSRASGVNAQQVSNQVLTNMSKMNQFTFQGGVEGLAKMAAQAVSLRVNMSSTLNLAERLFDPENAIEMAAAMQRLGATQSDLLDPLRLMVLAQNDPAELQNQIVKMSEKFVQLNKDGNFEIMPGARRQLMEISKAMGMTYDDITKMALGSAELDKKMKEIRFPDSAVSEEQRQMIANMAEVGKSGRYEVSFVTKDEETGKYEEKTKLVSELSEEDLKALGEASKDKSLEEIQKESLDVNKLAESHLASISESITKGAATSGVAGQLVGATRKTIDIGGKATDLPQLKPQSIRKITDETIGNFVDKLADLTNGKISFNSFMESMGKTEQKVIEFGDSLGSDALKNLEEALKKLSEDNNSVMRLASGVIKKFVESEIGTKPNTTGTEPIPAKDFVIKTLPEDEIRVVGGTNLNGNRNNQTTSSEIKVDFNLKIDSNNPNIDTNQLMIAMEKQEFKQKMIESLKDAYTNGKVGQIGNMISV